LTTLENLGTIATSTERRAQGLTGQPLERIIMTYDQAMEQNTVTAYAAKVEIEKHGLDFEDFIADYEEHETYCTNDIMVWLGY